MIIKPHKTDERGDTVTTVFPNRINFGGKSFLIPKGFESDGASVPRFFWRLVCPPVDPHAVRAGVAHDYIYRVQPADWTRADADRMFVCFLIEDGLPPFRAKLAYWGVRLFGGRIWRENAANRATAEAAAEIKAEAKKKK